MNQQIIISGVGGQGVLFITRLLAQACMEQGRHVLTSETHGMAQRGGTVISHLKVGTFSSPMIRPGKADLLIALKPETYMQHKGFLTSAGKAIVNVPSPSPGFEECFCLNADVLPGTHEKKAPVNLFMLGGALAVFPICPLDLLKKQILTKLKRLDATAKETAIKAVDLGFASVKEQ